MERDLPGILNSFFIKTQVDELLKQAQLFIFRRDGVVLYYENHSGSGDPASVGALMGGMWQAAHALSSFVPTKEESDCYRLSFDTSSKGVYLLSLEENSGLYLGSIFHNEINPALIKLKLRGLTFKLKEYLSSSEGQVSKGKVNDDEFLFNKISDDEIENMFQFVGL